MKVDCEVRWCKAKDVEVIPVNENIGDGCWRVNICKTCAAAIGIEAGDDLPDGDIVYRRLQRARKAEKQKADPASA